MTTRSGTRYPEDLDVLALAYAGNADDAARDRFTRHCLPLARRLAYRFCGRGESLEDLEQVARLGLVKAVDRYDPAQGSFTAYAVTTISGELKRYFRDAAWGVHVPRPVRDLVVETRVARAELISELARTPTPAEIGARIGSTEDAVLDALIANGGYSSTSLDAAAPVLGERLGRADAELARVDDRMTLSGLLTRLPVRERRLLAMRFYGNRTQVEIAAELGISQMQVSRLLSRALGWLREAMLNDVSPVWNGRDPMTPGLRLTVDHRDGAVTVRARGEIDRDYAPRLRICLRHAVVTAGTDKLIVDLAGVPLIDASGVAALADAASAAAAAGVPLTLVRAGAAVRPILQLSGLAHLLTR